ELPETFRADRGRRAPARRLPQGRTRSRRHEGAGQAVDGGGGIRADSGVRRPAGQVVRGLRPLLISSEGLRPSDSPTRALARRAVGALRSRGSLAVLARSAFVRWPLLSIHEVPPLGHEAFSA